MEDIDFEKKTVEFNSYYDENFDFLLSASEVFRTLIYALLVDTIPTDSVTARIKAKQECLSKFKRKYLADLETNSVDYNIKDHITDIVGLRVVCLYMDDIKEIQNLIENNFKEIEITDKISQLDSTADKFGYKGLHLDLMINDTRSSLPEYSKFKDVKFELQIRTIIQDAWSVLDHKIKYKKSIPNELKRRINRLSALFEVADEEFLRIKSSTQREQEKARAEITKKGNQLDESIDVFIFLELVKPYFPNYRFIEYKADGFVGDLLKCDPEFSTTILVQALEKYMKKIELYLSSSSSYMNPYTQIRHCIYLSNKEKYKNILYEGQRVALENWLSSNPGV